MDSGISEDAQEELKDVLMSVTWYRTLMAQVKAAHLAGAVGPAAGM